MADLTILRAVEDGIEMVPRPFEAAAKRAGTDEESVVRELKTVLENGTIRFFGAIVDHRTLGKLVNAMVAWDVEDSAVDSVGRSFAAIPMVSHCYERTRVPGKWKYNLFTMAHAGNEDELEAFLKEGRRLTTGADCIVLRTLKEYKKTGVKF